MTDAHGYGPYTNGCRCDVCKAAKADYQRAKRADARAVAAQYTTPMKTSDRPVVPGRRRMRVGDLRYVVAAAKHGSAASYIELGCRCIPCTDALIAKRAAERSRARRRAERAS